MTEEFLTAVDSEEMIFEPPVQSSEVQGNGTLSRGLHFTQNLSFDCSFLSSLYLSFPLLVIHHFFFVCFRRSVASRVYITARG